MDQTELNGFRLIRAAATRATSLSFNVMLDGTMRLSKKLREQIQAKYVRIWMGPDGSQILLEIAEEGMNEICKVPNNGYIKAGPLKDELAKVGIKLPAKYHVEWDTSINRWRGEYDKDFEFPVNYLPKKRISRPRKSDLQAMLP